MYKYKLNLKIMYSLIVFLLSIVLAANPNNDQKCEVATEEWVDDQQVPIKEEGQNEDVEAGLENKTVIQHTDTATADPSLENE